MPKRNEASKYVAGHYSTGQRRRPRRTDRSGGEPFGRRRRERGKEEEEEERFKEEKERRRRNRRGNRRGRSQLSIKGDKDTFLRCTSWENECFCRLFPFLGGCKGKFGQTLGVWINFFLERLSAQRGRNRKPCILFSKRLRLPLPPLFSPWKQQEADCLRCRNVPVTYCYAFSPPRLFPFMSVGGRGKLSPLTLHMST